MPVKKILFICTHNSARSQMAEGFLRALKGNQYEVFSAGTEPCGINPHAISVMAEVGIDLTSHRSKNIDDFQGMSFDEIVTVCDSARESCPVFPGEGQRLHKGFPDPSLLQGSEEEMLAGFRTVRDEIRQWISEKY